jgi:hypothetical protein
MMLGYVSQIVYRIFYNRFREHKAAQKPDEKVTSQIAHHMLRSVTAKMRLLSYYDN